MRSEIAKKHSSEAFYALDNPLEAAVFSVLLELVKEMDKNERSAKTSLSSPASLDLAKSL
jgi:hypothetical protein